MEKVIGTERQGFECSRSYSHVHGDFLLSPQINPFSFDLSLKERKGKDL